MAELSFANNMPRPSNPLHGRGRGGSCPYCKRAMDKKDAHLKPTKDHTIPVSRGGKVWIWCCNLCNQYKGDMMPSEWDRYMREHPKWWLQTKGERHAERKARRARERTEKWGPRSDEAPHT